MNRPLRIAMFGQKHVNSREGGVEIVVHELASRMSEIGHEVVCFDRSSHHVAGSEYDSDCNQHSFKVKNVLTINKKGLAAMTSSISAAICSALGKYDVVHIHAEGPAAMCWLPKIFGKKVVVTIHGLDWERSKWGGLATKYIKFGEKTAVKRADEIIVLSDSVKKYFEDTYNRKTVYIPNGVSKPVIRPAKEIRDRWGLEKDSYILYLGRIVPEKGLLYLIEAWKRVQTSKKLVIAGGSSDTEDFFNEVKSKASESVIFTGFQQGRVLEELFSNAYVYTLPSDLEGMPLSLLEAMSYGNCCVTSDIPECAEVISNKGILFKKGNIESLTDTLQKVLDNPEVVDSYKNQASDYICQRYNWDTVVKRTLEIYE